MQTRSLNLGIILILVGHFVQLLYTVKPRFLNTIRSGRLFKNRFARKLNHIFSLQIVLKRLIRSMYQKNNLFACLHYTLYIIVQNHLVKE